MIRVQFFFAWYDAWIGIYWDRKKKALYILPLPCIGIVIQFRKRETLTNGFSLTVKFPCKAHPHGDCEMIHVMVCAELLKKEKLGGKLLKVSKDLQC
jgi:hypothetical protein